VADGSCLSESYSSKLHHDYTYTYTYTFFPPVERSPNAGQGLLSLEISKSRTTTHHCRQDSSGRVISASQRPLPDNTQHSQQIDFNATGGIRTHKLSRRAAVDLRLKTARPLGPAHLYTAHLNVLTLHERSLQLGAVLKIKSFKILYLVHQFPNYYSERQRLPYGSLRHIL
jgi:hypothetical protein